MYGGCMAYSSGDIDMWMLGDADKVIRWTRCTITTIIMPTLVCLLIQR